MIGNVVMIAASARPMAPLCRVAAPAHVSAPGSTSPDALRHAQVRQLTCPVTGVPKVRLVARQEYDALEKGASMLARSTCFAFTVLFALTFAACGDDDENGGAIDAAVTIDAPGGGGDGGNTDAAAAPTCTDYCTTIAANCTAANLMYASTAECMATCTKFTPGTVGQTSGNTLGCRLYHANNAAGSTANANTHCRHGGPGGDGLCGTNCEGFCTIVQGSCSTQAQPPYADMAACMTACGGYATTPIYVANPPQGNTLTCRLYHATAAANAPGTHCSHTSQAGGGVCQ
jgi:hypothetical protein